VTVELTIKGGVETLHLEPGDVVVITLEGEEGEDLYPSLTEALAEQWKEATGLPNRVVVVSSGLTVTKLERAAQA
jgi:hypothetical protein